MSKFRQVILESDHFGREELPDGTIRYEEDGIIEYLKNDMYHRIGGPAYINIHNKSVEWRINGVAHRVDGPAIKHGDYEAWYLNGKYHRLDGPAITYENGTKVYYVHGKMFSEEEFHKHFGEG